MGVCFMLVILKQFFLPNLKVASILLCLAFVYGALPLRAVLGWCTLALAELAAAGAAWACGQAGERPLSCVPSGFNARLPRLPSRTRVCPRPAPSRPPLPQTCGGCSFSRW